MKNDFSKKNLSIKLCAILLSSSALFAQETQAITKNKTNTVGNTTVLEEISVKENQSFDSTSYTIKESSSATKLDFKLRITGKFIKELYIRFNCFRRIRP